MKCHYAHEPCHKRTDGRDIRCGKEKRKCSWKVLGRPFRLSATHHYSVRRPLVHVRCWGFIACTLFGNWRIPVVRKASRPEQRWPQNSAAALTPDMKVHVMAWVCCIDGFATACSLANLMGVCQCSRHAGAMLLQFSASVSNFSDTYEGAKGLTRP